MTREIGRGNGTLKTLPRENRLAGLSKIYFSSADRADERATTPDPLEGIAAPRVVALWNTTGLPGERFLDSAAAHLDRRGLPHLPLWPAEDGYRIGSPESPRVDSTAVRRELASRDEPAVLILRFGQQMDEQTLSAFRNCRKALILADGHLDSLEASYRILRSARGKALVVVYRPMGKGLWDHIAPLRLAEAAVRFLGRRISIWYTDTSEAVASRIEREFARPIAPRTSAARIQPRGRAVGGE